MSDRPDALPELERESDLLPKDPPPAAMRVATDIVLGFFLVAVVFVSVMKLPATATGRFVLRPAAGLDPIAAPWDAVVERVAVQLGSVVAEGELLYVLRAEGLRELSAERARLREELQSDAESLAALRGGGASATAVPLLARLARLEKQRELELGLAEERARRHDTRVRAQEAELRRREVELRERRARLETLKALMDSLQAARDEGVTSARSLLEERAAYESARADLQHTIREKEAAEGGLAMLAAERAVELREQEQELAGLEGELDETIGEIRQLRVEIAGRVAGGEARLISLERALATTDGDRLEVRAPWAGSVVALGVERAGRTVTRGDLLCELAPLDGELVAHVSLAETEAARVREGQEVRLLLDAYPHARHGVKTGRLTWVSPTAKEGEFLVIAELKESGIRVDGESVQLRAGLEGEARVRTGQRSLLESVLAPLREVRENVAPD